MTHVEPDAEPNAMPVAQPSVAATMPANVVRFRSPATAQAMPPALAVPEVPQPPSAAERVGTAQYLSARGVERAQAALATVGPERRVRLLREAALDLERAAKLLREAGRI